jgi:hypothetical protein
MNLSESKSAIVTIDDKGIIQSVDKSCCQLFGYNFSPVAVSCCFMLTRDRYEAHELIGQKINILVPPPYKVEKKTKKKKQKLQKSLQHTKMLTACRNSMILTWPIITLLEYPKLLGRLELSKPSTNPS